MFLEPPQLTGKGTDGVFNMEHTPMAGVFRRGGSVEQQRAHQQQPATFEQTAHLFAFAFPLLDGHIIQTPVGV